MELETWYETYDAVERALKWRVGKPQLVSLAAMYHRRGKSFDEAEWKAIRNEWNRQTKWYSFARGQAYYLLYPALLDASDRAREMERLQSAYNQLVTARFPRGAFTYMAARYVESESHVERAALLYKQLKKTYRFVATPDDIPFVLLVMKRTWGVEEALETIQQYVDAFQAIRLKKGNERLWLAQLFAAAEGNFSNERVERFIEEQRTLERVGERFEAKQYPFVGMLALVELTEKEKDEWVEHYERLTSREPLRSLRSFALWIALEQTVDVTKGEVEWMISTIVEMMHEAQSAAIATYAAIF